MSAPTTPVVVARTVAVPSTVRLGIVANLILAASMATAWGYSQPMFGTADEAAHFDYAYQLWTGRLPIFEQGLAIRPSFGFQPPVQWTAQHPPLYYVLVAPIVGPLVEADHYLAAGLAARSLNALLAAALVAAAMSAASAIAPGRTALWLATGTVTGLYPLVVQLGGAIYNDVLIAAWSALLVGLTATMVRSGASRRRLLLFAAVGASALLTRLSAAPIIVGCAAAATVAIVGTRPLAWRTLGGLWAAVGFAAAASAWFYQRNVVLTGNLAGGHFGYLPHRVQRPFAEVLTRHEVWHQLLAIHGFDLLNPVLATLVLVGVPVAIACARGVRRLWRYRGRTSETILVGLVGVVLAMQLSYVAAGGGASQRYLAPLTVVAAVAVAAGLTAAPRFAPLIVVLWATVEFDTVPHFTILSLRTPSTYSAAPVFVVPTVVSLVAAGAAIAAAAAAQVAVGARHRRRRHQAPD